MPDNSTMAAEEIGPGFESLLEYLKRSRGFDFTGYKRSTLVRRIDKRMQTVEVDTYTSYVDYLEVHPDEFVLLFNTILINVTAFFRDTAAWTFVQNDVVPRILSDKLTTESVRIWSAGCASGEEAYTLAMILASAMGIDEFRERVKIYATDADEEALAQARQASYTAREVTGIPEEYLEKYFERQGQRFVFNKELRRSVIFGRHDLIQDAPISRIDLLVCRNALMYFNAEMQTKILTRLHFALNESGFLFLGKAEMLFTHGNLFTPYDLKQRIFVNVPRGEPRIRSPFLAPSENGQAPGAMHDMSMREAAFDHGPLAHILISSEGLLAHANERARSIFRLSPRDIGRPLQDLELSYRPVELRSCIEQAYIDRRPVNVKEAAWPPHLTDMKFVDVQIMPLQDPNGGLLGASVCYTDVTRYKQLHEELQESNRELETAHEELQSTNEELETTNEELQSTVEELETTNEELQSTNEELETMNEELQSTNEELQTINEELRQRSGELSHVNAFVTSILASLQSGIVVVDEEMQIQIWNDKTVDLWGLRPEEVQGKHFLNLDIGLPLDELKHAIRTCLTGESKLNSVVLEARNRRGKLINCKVVCGQLTGAKNDIRGVIMLMEEIPLTSEAN